MRGVKPMYVGRFRPPTLDNGNSDVELLTRSKYLVQKQNTVPKSGTVFNWGLPTAVCLVGFFFDDGVGRTDIRANS